MNIVVDSSALALLINPGANPPDDPSTGKPLANAQERIEHFLASLTASDTIIVPTPVLAEILVRAGDSAPDVLANFGDLARVRTKGFGDRAAVETAAMTREAIEAGDKRGGSTQPWQKVKIDRQIIAIARCEGAARIYADDHALIEFARRLGMDVFSTWDLPRPPDATPLFTAAGVDVGSLAAPASMADPAVIDGDSSMSRRRSLRSSGRKIMTIDQLARPRTLRPQSEG